jgi:hypothetical protein
MRRKRIKLHDPNNWIIIIISAEAVAEATDPRAAV